MNALIRYVNPSLGGKNTTDIFDITTISKLLILINFEISSRYKKIENIMRKHEHTEILSIKMVKMIIIII